MVEGEDFHGEVSSADASTATAFTIYDVRGVARPLAAGERVIITDITLVCGGTGLTLNAFFDNNANGSVDGGERIAGGTFAANGGLAMQYATGRMSPAFVASGGPKLKASGAGQVDCVICGKIIAGTRSIPKV